MGKFAVVYIVKSCEKSGGRSFRMTPRCTWHYPTHRLSPGSKLFFRTVVGWLTCWVRSYDSWNMEHAAPGSELRAPRSSNASSVLPGPPAGGRGKDGRIHNDSSRYSTAAQREVTPLCLYLYICCHHFFVHLIFVSLVACLLHTGHRARRRTERRSVEARSRSATGGRG